MPTLPRYTEHKVRLNGERARFECELVERESGVVRLRYRLPRSRRVDVVELPAGTVTLAHYWAECPYNLYQWIGPDGEALGYYFNIGAPPVMLADHLEWTDWIVDVLVPPGGVPEILDRDEIPPGLAGALVARIEAALDRLMGEIEARIAEAEAARARLLWRLLPDRDDGPAQIRDARQSPDEPGRRD
jgi:hypothetical protein